MVRLYRDLIRDGHKEGQALDTVSERYGLSFPYVFRKVSQEHNNTKGK